MKKFAPIIAVLILCLLSGCREDSQFNVWLDEMDSLMQTRPDSAYILLQEHADSITHLPKSQQMHYFLLSAKAQNKAYVDFTTDSLMLTVTEYYDQHGTPNERMMAHYLLGCCYRDMGEAPRTIECYKEALSCADTLSNDCDYRTMMSISGQMATLYDKQVMPEEELEALEMSGKYAMKSGDTINYIRNIQLQTRAYTLLQDTAKIFAIVQQTRNAYLQSGHKKEGARALAAAIQAYVLYGKFHEAKEAMQIYESESGFFDEEGNIAPQYSSYYKTKALYYQGINCLDSAEHLYNKLLSFGHKVNAYHGLLGIYQERGIPDSIKKYCTLYENAYDEYFTNLNTASVRQTEAMYDYTRNQRIAYEKQLESAHFKWHMFILCIVFMFVCLLFVYLYKKQKAMKQKELDNARKEFHDTEQEYESELHELGIIEETHKQLILILQQKLDDSQVQIETERNNIRKQRQEKAEIYHQLKKAEKDLIQETAKHREEVSKLRNKIKELSEQESLAEDFKRSRSMLESEPVRELYRLAIHLHIKPSTYFWDRLIQEVSKRYPALIQDILHHKDISIQGVRCILASILQVRSSDIANLLDTTPQRISNLRSELNQVLFNNSSARTFVKNIMDRYEIILSQDDIDNAKRL